jgi:transcriptional regulator with XRE-family HTH domain
MWFRQTPLEDDMPANQNLKTLRDSRNVTVREVELESRRIAKAKGDKRFYISNARLTQLENDPLSEPSLWKLFSLSAIYHVRITELMRFYNVDADESDKYNAIATPGRTRLLSDVPDVYRTSEFLRGLVKFPDKTTLLPRVVQAGDDKPDVVTPDPDNQFTTYGYIGLDDFTMYPLIRPGSFVALDTRQNKLRLIAWCTEYERPIYFVELRDGYSCGWCELQGNQLLLIPHHSSPVSIRRFTYPREIEIVGRVMKFSTRCVDRGFPDSETPKRRNK